MAEPKKHLDKIIINELLCQAILGVKKSERIAKQNIVFHLTGWIDLSEAGKVSASFPLFLLFCFFLFLLNSDIFRRKGPGRQRCFPPSVSFPSPHIS
jgi:hypothetical protein